MRYVLSQVPYPNKNPDINLAPDPLIVGSAAVIYEEGEHVLTSEDQVSSGSDK
jgi:hypothetical protein